MEEEKGILEIISEDNSLITYRPSLNKVIKSVTATILFQQILHLWKIMGWTKFFKFKEPCAHVKYKKGDSWIESLGFTKKEFDGALKKIGFKLGKTKNEIKKEDALVIYYRDSSGLTWYDPQPDKIKNLLNKIYLVSDKRGFTKETPKGDLAGKRQKVTYPITEKPEITTEILIFNSDNDVSKKNSHSEKSDDGNNSSDINNLIRLFEPVNRANYKDFYRNKFERKALQDLVDIYGCEMVGNAIRVLPQTNGQDYMPSIVTPSELKKKWSKLEDGLKRKKQQQVQEKKKIIIA